jgi:hypothetical protein
MLVKKKKELMQKYIKTLLINQNQILKKFQLMQERQEKRNRRMENRINETIIK